MIKLIHATPDQKPLIANLIQLYLYDMTKSMPFAVGPDGRFEYDFLDRFWRFPYLIYSGEEIAGFALVIDECPLTGQKPCWFMAEFFVLRAYRGKGIGQGALALAAANHSGYWHIAAPTANQPAQAFWSTALRPYTPTSTMLVFEGDEWRLNSFAT